MEKRLSPKYWIGGTWHATASGGTYAVHDPSTGEKIVDAPQTGEREVEAAVSAASRAQATWGTTDPWKRATMLRRISTAFAERREELAQCMARELGKPLEQGRGEVQVAIEQFDWYADETRRILGEIVESRSPRLAHLVRYQPVGVVAAFSPWNFPVALVARKVAPALAAGCAIIVRPAEEAPLTATVLFECIEQGGLPPGTVNYLCGKPQQITPSLLRDPAVRKISFTGSVAVGKMLAREASATLKKVTLELGGHAPVVVFDDVDVAAVARLSVQSKFRNAGQICVSPTRFFVHDAVKTAFESEFAKLATALKLGSPVATDTQLGPLTTSNRLDHLQELVDDALSRGARRVAGGRRSPAFARGNFYEPTVLADVPSGARVMREEPFGPLAVINGFSDADEAYRAANDTPFGLAAYAFTTSLAHAMEAGKRLEAGVVCINSYAASTTEIPFGGIKDSGYGRECGTHGILEYLEAKTINMTF